MSESEHVGEVYGPQEDLSFITLVTEMDLDELIPRMTSDQRFATRVNSTPVMREVKRDLDARAGIAGGGPGHPLWENDWLPGLKQRH